MKIESKHCRNGRAGGKLQKWGKKQRRNILFMFTTRSHSNKIKEKKPKSKHDIRISTRKCKTRRSRAEKKKRENYSEIPDETKILEKYY